MSLQKLFASCAHHWGQLMIHGPKDVFEEIFLVCSSIYTHFQREFKESQLLPFSLCRCRLKNALDSI